MKKILLGFMLIVSCFAFGQDVKFKKNIVLVDGNEWAKYNGCGIFDAECSIIKGDSEVIYVINKIVDRSLISKYNKDGEVSWKEVKFLGLEKSYEVQDSDKDFVRDLIKSNVFNDDNTFNENNVDRLVEKKGKKFSRRYYNN